jgi:hypothetical protein
MTEVKFITDYNDGASLEILGDDDFNYHIQFFDNNNDDELIYEDTIKCNHWVKTGRKYFTEWRIVVLRDGINVFSDIFDCYEKQVIIYSDSTALGDNIGYAPYFEEFRKKHNCKLSVYSKFSWLLKNYYPEIEWENIDEKLKPYATYHIGVGIDTNVFDNGIKKLNEYFNKHIPIKYIPGLTFFDKNKHPEHPIQIPLQKMAANILGLKFKEIRPKFTIDCEKPLDKKYVCISEFASNIQEGMKMWNNQIGWKTIVTELKNRGYEVVSVSKEKSELKNIIKINGNYPMNTIMAYLKYAEFFIGLSSGLSWLNWALGKKTVMIAGFTEDWFEFQEDCIRVKNYEACGGCFNSKEHADKLCCFHMSFCPENKKFECGRKISPKMVINKIIENNLV